LMRLSSLRHLLLYRATIQLSLQERGLERGFPDLMKSKYHKPDNLLFSVVLDQPD
jgi:hypothetical protein